MNCPNCNKEMEEVEDNYFGCTNCKISVYKAETNYITEDLEKLYNSCKEATDEIIKTINAQGTKH